MLWELVPTYKVNQVVLPIAQNQKRITENKICISLLLDLPSVKPLQDRSWM